MRRVPAGSIPAAGVAVVIIAAIAAIIVACASPYGDDGNNNNGSSSGSSGAGSDSGAPEASSTLPTRQTMETFAGAFCDKLADCASTGLIRHTFGNASTCKARHLAEIELSVGSAGYIATDAAMQACKAAIANAPCADLVIGAQPKECNIRGTLALGTTCATDPQCASGLCSTIPGATCGKCTARVVEGGDCTSTFCEQGLRCDSKKKCVKPGALGAKCVEDMNCTPPLICFQDKCTKPLARGEPCKVATMGEIPCNQYEYVYCAPASETDPAGTCSEFAFATVGGACGATQTTPLRFTLCENGDCNVATLRCEAHLADGQSCDLTKGFPSCLEPADCRAGTCRLADPSICK